MSVAFEHHQPIQVPEMLDEEHIHHPLHPIHSDLQDHAQPSSSSLPQSNWFAPEEPSPVYPTLDEQEPLSAAPPLPLPRHQFVPPSVPSHDPPSTPFENGPSPSSLQPHLFAPVQPLVTLQPDSLSHPHLTQPIEPTVHPAPASCPEVTIAELDSPSAPMVPSQPCQTEHAVLDGDEKTASSLDHASTLLDDSLAQIDPESDQLPEEELDCEPHWDTIPLADEMPYEDYEELDSRPKVRTDLLEHVRVEFEVVSLDNQDQSLPMESDLTPAPPVTLRCEGCEYSLFQRKEPCSKSDAIQTTANDETVLLSEPECRELYYGPLEAFIQSLHNIFPNLHDNNKNELVLNFPTLEIKVPEDNIYSKEISLFDVDRLHIGARLADRLLISLEKQPRLVHRFNVLATYVSELAEHNPNMDGNSGEVLIEEDSDSPDDPLVVDQKDDADQPEIFEESTIPESSATHDVPTLPIAVDQPDVFPTTAEELPSIDAAIVVTSPKDVGEQPPSTLATTDSSHVDDLSSSSTLNYVAVRDSAREQPEITTDDLTIVDGSSVAQLTESHQLLEDTDQFADELSRDPHVESLETLPEDVNEFLEPDPVVESTEEVFVRLDADEPPQECTKDNILNGAGSCSNSERTITGLGQLSEGEIEEFVEEESGILLDADATLVHDPNDGPLNDDLALDVNAADQHENSSAPCASIYTHDSVTINVLSTDPSLSHVGSKRNRAEAEDPAGGFEPTVGDAAFAVQSSDMKRARVL